MLDDKEFLNLMWAEIDKAEHRNVQIEIIHQKDIKILYKNITKYLLVSLLYFCTLILINHGLIEISLLLCSALFIFVYLIESKTTKYNMEG